LSFTKAFTVRPSMFSSAPFTSGVKMSLRRAAVSTLKCTVFSPPYSTQGTRFSRRSWAAPLVPLGVRAVPLSTMVFMLKGWWWLCDDEVAADALVGAHPADHIGEEVVHGKLFDLAGGCTRCGAQGNGVRDDELAEPALFDAFVGLAAE